MSESDTRPTRMIVCNGRLEAFIKVDGKELEIYSEERPDEGRKGCVISEIGKSYSIHLLARSLPAALTTKSRPSAINRYHLPDIPFKDSYPSFACELFIDGKSRDNRGTSSDVGCFKSPSGESMEFVTVPVSAGAGQQGKPVCTSPILSEDADRLTTDAASDIGKIKLLIRRLKWCKTYFNVSAAGNATSSKQASTSDTTKFNEKDKKAQIGSVTTFQDLVDVGPSSTRREHSEYHPDDRDTPFFTFEFVYATKDLLMAQDGEYGDVPPEKVIDVVDLNEMPDPNSDDDEAAIDEGLEDAQQSGPAIDVESYVARDVIDLDASSDEDEEEDVKPQIKHKKKVAPTKKKSKSKQKATTKAKPAAAPAPKPKQQAKRSDKRRDSGNAQQVKEEESENEDEDVKPVSRRRER